MKRHKLLSTIFAFAFGAAHFCSASVLWASDISPYPDARTVQNAGQQPQDPFVNTVSGNYLASQFAQRHHDWDRAGHYLENLLRAAPGDVQILKKAMVLAMGSGEPRQALGYAKRVITKEPDNSLALLFLTVGAFQEGNYPEASRHIDAVPEESLSKFMLPLLRAWAAAAQGQYSTEALGQNSIHLFHAIMIADFMGKKDEIEPLLKKAEKNPARSPEDTVQIADLYAHIGHNEKAVQLYRSVMNVWPDPMGLERKIKGLESGEHVQIFEPVASAEQGVARAIDDMARLLYREYADDSARVFAQMGLYLDPKLDDLRLLLAAVAARNGQYDEAIDAYRSVPLESPYYLQAQHDAIDLMEEAGDVRSAMAALEKLALEKHSVESRIKIGDIFRRREDFENAIKHYNLAVQDLGGTVPSEYWHLLYARGMSHERAGQWEMAEADLKAALAYQPEHPYILNYLGYAWAQQGIHLDKALELIRKAVNLMPGDGAIIDSLGWVYFRMGRYEEAVPHLEKAAELMPYDPVINDHLGDAYWQVGRKLEARFQWQRAQNNSQDPLLLASLSQKLEHGLKNPDIIREAKSALPQH